MERIYGIDLSKEKFDVNFLNDSLKEVHIEYKNTFKGIMKFLKTIPGQSVLVAEHTGVYGELLVYLSSEMGIRICLSSGYNIKHSLGLRKGKTDKLDARRIREFGERYYDKLQQAEPISAEMRELQELYSLRSQFVKERKMLLTNQEKKSQSIGNSIAGHRLATRVLKTLDESIDSIEHEITEIIWRDEEMKQNYQLVTSVKGIGQVTGCELIIKTTNFTKIKDARKIASYAGVCPFPNASGKMVKKSKVSPMSDKELKSLLYMCSKSAVKHNMQYKLYYQKKQLEGKPHYLIMNNVANKLLRTICSIIESRKPWDPNYVCLDPRELKNIA